jgi:hypothetical protein
MSTIIFEDYGLAVSRDSEGYYLIYNAGSHGMAMREDPISDDEATEVMAGPREATKVLIALQRRVAEGGNALRQAILRHSAG